MSLTLQIAMVMILGVGPLEDNMSPDEITPYRKGLRSVLPLPTCNDTANGVTYETGTGFLYHRSALIFDFLTLNFLLSANYFICGILLQQPERAKTGIQAILICGQHGEPQSKGCS